MPDLQSPPQKNTTLETVAQEAGVSMKSVSRVLNGEPFVSEKMRLKVNDAIAKLEFKPNMAARQLRGQRSYSVAVIYEPPASEFLTGVLEGVLPACREASYKLLLEPLAATESRKHIFKMIETRAADGFILLPPLSEDPSLISAIINANCAVVLVASSIDIEHHEPSVSKVGIDDFSAGYELGQYFIEHGHTHIGYIGLREQHVMANRRGEGLQAAMLDAGIPKENFRHADGYATFESGFEAAQQLLSPKVPPTAIFAGNDYMAAGVISCATGMGLKIPENLSVAGFDGADLSEMFVPPFMTIKQPLKEYGQWAVKRLLETLAAPEKNGVEESLSYTLLPRNSVRNIT
ncbi:MAG: LacI family DNA-binding transcriptional regulator [Litorimonas sp.]